MSIEELKEKLEDKIKSTMSKLAETIMYEDSINENIQRGKLDAYTEIKNKLNGCVSDPEDEIFNLFEKQLDKVIRDYRCESYSKDYVDFIKKNAEKLFELAGAIMKEEIESAHRALSEIALKEPKD